MITASSPIVGKGGTVDEALAALDTPDATDAEYVGTLFRLCAETGLDYRIAFGQFCVETANGTSPRWLTNRNPAGLGIAADGDPDPGTFDGTEAAMVHVWALTEAIDADIVITTDQLPKSAQGFAKRWTAKYASSQCPTVLTVADLCRHYTDASGEQQSTWAWDTTYADQIVAKANAIFVNSGSQNMEESSMPEATVTFGKVPKPAVVDRHLDTTNPWISLDATDRQIEAVVWHRMLGTLQGTDGWFRGEHAATAYGIGVAATDGDALAGTIYEWIDPASRYYGESSGPVSAPYGDGLALFNLVGISQVNARSEAIEISGDYDKPLDDKAREALVALTAWFADRRGIPWTSFPIVPGTTRSFVVWHQEITIGTGKVCPGQVVMDETPALIAAVAERLKQYQGGTGTIPVPPPEPKVPSVPWDANATGIHKLNDANALAFLGEVTARKVVPLFLNATLKKEFKIGEMQPNEKGVIRGTVISGGKRIALVEHKNGVARARLSDFHERWPTP